MNTLTTNKMKVALCFIISYEHILHKEQLWKDWIKPNQDIINVYFHYKDINMIRSPWIKMYTIDPKMCKHTSYYNVVPAYMAVLTYAFNHDENNVWFSLLTDTCVPAISPERFRQMFFDHFNASILTCRPAYWDIRIHRRANLRLLKKEYWLANDPWFTLTRNHVHKCIIFLAAKHGIYDIVNKGGLANESIFAIILQTFGELGNPMRFVNASSTVADWSRMMNPTSPYLFKEATDENMLMLNKLLKENPYALFLRKVHRSFPDEKLKELWEKDFGHEYPFLHNHAKRRETTERRELTGRREEKEDPWTNGELFVIFVSLMPLIGIILYWFTLVNPYWLGKGL